MTAESGETVAAMPPDASSTMLRGITHRTLAGLAWMFLGTGCRGLAQLLVLSVLARLLTVGQFGVITAGLSVTSFAVNLSAFGIGPAVVQFADLQVRHLRTALSAALCSGAAATALIWWAAPAVGAFFKMDALVPVLRALSLVCLIRAAGVAAEGLLQRQMRFRLLAGIDTAAYAAGYGVVGIVMARLGYGVWAFVGGYLALTTIRVGLLLAAGGHPFLPAVDRRALGELVRFGAGLSLGKAGNYIATEGDNVVVGRWLGAEALGLYGRVYQLMAMPAMFIGEILDNVLFPGMSRLRVQPELLRVAYRRSVALVALVALPTSAALLVLAPEIIRVVLGSKWLGAVVPFQIFALGVFFRTGYKISDAAVRAEGAVYRRAWRQTAYALLVLGGAWAGQRWGLRGVAVGVVTAIGVNFVLMAQLTLALTGLSWPAFCRAHLPGAALAAVAGVELWGLRSWLRALGAPSPAVVGLAGGVTLVTLFLLLRWAPGQFLGRDGRWMLKTLAAYLPERLRAAGWLGWDAGPRPAAEAGGRGTGGALIVEFAGLPGVGKSTLAARVAQLLREAGVAVDEPRRESTQRRFARISREALFVIAHALRRPAYALRSAAAILASRQRSPYAVLRELHNWLFVSLSLYRRRDAAVRLLDQGAFQALWGIGYGGEPRAMDGVLRRLVRAMPKPDLVVLLEADLATVKRRLAMRPHKHSRMDRLPPDAHAMFARAERSLAEVRRALTRAAGETPPIAYHVIDNDGDGVRDSNAAHIVACILRLRAAGPGTPRAEAPGEDQARYAGVRG